MHVLIFLSTLSFCFVVVSCQVPCDIEKITSGLEALQKQVQSQETRIAELEGTVIMQRQINSRLTAELSHQNSQRLKVYRELKTVKALVAKSSHLETDQGQEKHSNVPDDVGKQNSSRVSVPKDRPLPELHGTPSEGKRFLMDPSENPVVAFQASIAENHRTVNFQLEQTIVFDTVNINLGNSYHSKYGLFVAPVDGIYIFSTTVAIAHTDHMIIHVDIEKNGVEIAGGVAYDASNSYEQCSVTVVVDLAVNDKVYVNVERHANVTVYGDRLTSFMGCLIHASATLV